MDNYTTISETVSYPRHWLVAIIAPKPQLNEWTGRIKKMGPLHGKYTSIVA
jgi:hypothetical protein